MGSLLVVTGPPGSGKSTVSALLAQQTGPSALVQGDQFFAFLARDAAEPWFLDTFGSATGLTELDYVVLMPSADTCAERVSSRAGHPFRDAAATRKMHDEFARAAAVDSRHVLTVGSATVAGVVDQINEARETGQLTYSVARA